MNNPATRSASCDPILQGLNTVDPHVLYAGCELVGLVVRRMVLNCRGVQNDDVERQLPGSNYGTVDGG